MKKLLVLPILFAAILQCETTNSLGKLLEKEYFEKTEKQKDEYQKKIIDRAQSHNKYVYDLFKEEVNGLRLKGLVNLKRIVSKNNTWNQHTPQIKQNIYNRIANLCKNNAFYKETNLLTLQELYSLKNLVSWAHENSRSVINGLIHSAIKIKIDNAWQNSNLPELIHQIPNIKNSAHVILNLLTDSQRTAMKDEIKKAYEKLLLLLQLSDDTQNKIFIKNNIYNIMRSLGTNQQQVISALNTLSQKTVTYIYNEIEHEQNKEITQQNNSIKTVLKKYKQSIQKWYLNKATTIIQNEADNDFEDGPFIITDLYPLFYELTLKDTLNICSPLLINSPTTYTKKIFKNVLESKLPIKEKTLQTILPTISKKGIITLFDTVGNWEKERIINALGTEKVMQSLGVSPQETSNCIYNLEFETLAMLWRVNPKFELRENIKNFFKRAIKQKIWHAETQKAIEFYAKTDKSFAQELEPNLITNIQTCPAKKIKEILYEQWLDYPTRVFVQKNITKEQDSQITDIFAQKDFEEFKDNL